MRVQMSWVQFRYIYSCHGKCIALDWNFELKKLGADEFSEMKNLYSNCLLNV